MRIVVAPGNGGDAVEVIVTRLTAGPATLRAAARLLTSAERRRARHLAVARMRRRFIVGRAGLRLLLGARLGVRPQAVELVYGPHGKPGLAPRLRRRSDLRFNVAHCGDIALYAFATGGEIGVDVEAVRKILGRDAIAARFFSRRERAAYQRLPPRDRSLAFFNCWTRKEAFVKALGDGLSLPLDRFDVSLAPGEPARILRVDDTPGERCGWQVASFSPAPGFVAAVVRAQR